MGFLKYFAAISLLSFAGVASAEVAEEIECYDLKLEARIIEQVPGPFPDCGEDCIVMSWPWFIDLEIERVVDGDWEGQTVRTLRVQHGMLAVRRQTGQETKGDASTWLLRRNTAGGFNALPFTAAKSLGRCPPGSELAQSLIHPREGSTLDDVREEMLRQQRL